FYLVNQIKVEVLGNKAGPETLNLVGRGFDLVAPQCLGDDRGIRGLHRHSGNGFTFGLFNITGDAGQGAAGTNAGNKDIHFTIGIVPDFRAGGVFVNLRVSGILELLRQEVV